MMAGGKTIMTKRERTARTNAAGLYLLLASAET